MPVLVPVPGEAGAVAVEGLGRCAARLFRNMKTAKHRPRSVMRKTEVRAEERYSQFRFGPHNPKRR